MGWNYYNWRRGDWNSDKISSKRKIVGKQTGFKRFLKIKII